MTDTEDSALSEEDTHLNGFKIGNGHGNGHDLTPRRRDRSKSLNAQTHTGFRIARASRKAFLPDEEIAHSWTWQIAMFIFWTPNQFLHRISWEGYQLKPDESVLSVHMHTTHNRDIPFAILANYKRTGRITRGLVHRTIMAAMPWLGNIGMVPGFRDTADELLKQGFWVAVIPGGAEEAMRGHENAYTLDWLSSRRGFAKVAIRSSTPIVPIFYENMEEMIFNPVFWLWNLLKMSILYDMIINAEIPYISSFLKIVAESIWFNCTLLFAIPIPGKVTVHVGEPIKTSPESDVDEIVQKTRDGLQALIDKWQPGRKKSYRRAFRQWREDLVNDKYAWKEVGLQPNCQAQKQRLD